MRAVISFLAPLIIYGYFAICWIVNLIQFFQCDFEPSYKDEIIKLTGILLGPVAGITVWF